jgi:predicted permease
LWLAESTAIGALGAAAGILLAWAGVAALKSAAPPGIPRLDAVALDGPALTVAAVSTVLAVIAFTIAPHRGRAYALRSAMLRGGRTQHVSRMALTAAQCAGAATLVVLAVMLARSFVKLTSIDLGWDAEGVLSMHVSPPMPRELRRPWARYVDWSDRLVTRLEATPGIRRAAITTMVPLSAQTHPATLGRGRGKAAGDDRRWSGLRHVVSDAYFEVMGIRRISGRLFDARDRFTAEQLVDPQGRPDHGAVVVGETTARTLWPDRPAVGQVMWLPDIDNVAWREVVGVVEDIQFNAVGEAPVLHVFVPWTQVPTGSPRLVVKARAGAAAIADVVKAVVREVEPGTRIDQIAALDDLFLRATAQPRFTTRLVAGFGAFALLLAAVGIYGTLSYLVSARTREIGIRLALGAAPGTIMSGVLRRGLIPAMAGGLIGLALALSIARLFRSLFFEVAALDVASAASGGALLLIVAIVAAIVPARRASRVDPAVTLRAE